MTDRTPPRPAHARFRPTWRPPLAPIPQNPDVIVVGAGAAGIGAARHLIARGLSVAVLEARNRVGGRAVTTTLRGHAIDLGAHWLHAGPINPLVRLGRERGEPLRLAPQDGHVRVGRRPGLPREVLASARAFDVADRAMTAAAGRPGPDRPAETAVPPGLGPWGKRVALVHGLVSGRPLREVSLHDFPSQEYGDNVFVAGGYGAYVARLARGLPVALGETVSRIGWSGAGVEVDTAAGSRLRAGAVVVTLPLMVLKRSLRFDPPLPEMAREAVDGFLDGIYEHAVLHWPSSPFRGADRLVSLVGTRHAPPGLLARIDGTPFHYFELDAPCIAALDAVGGEDRVRRFVRSVLAEHVGHRAIADLSIPAVSEWRGDALARGSWAVVPPGHAHAREALKAPVGERIWFAGEALSRHQWGTAGGAWEEGVRAADAIAERLSKRVLAGTPRANPRSAA